MSESSEICIISPYAYSYLSEGASKRVGGAERQQYLLAQYLTEVGYNVTFVVFRDSGPKKEVIDGLSILKSIPRRSRRGFYVSTPAALYASLSEIDPDLVYVRGNPMLTILVGCIGKVRGDTLVYHFANDRDIEFISQPYHPKALLFRQSVGAYDVVLSQTESQKSMLNKIGIHSHHVPNTYTVPGKHTINSFEQRKYVLWVGRINRKQKQPHKLLQIADKTPDVEYIMIGPKQDSEYCEKICKKASEMNNVRFLGFVEPSKIHEYYKNAITLVNTSSYEGFPNTFLEALRCSTLVISMNIDVDGSLANCKTGVLSKSITNTAQSIRDFRNNPSYWEELSSTSRQHISDNYSIDKIGPNFAKVIDDVLSEKSSS